MSNRIIAKNAASLLISDVGVRAFSGIGAVLVARSLGPSSYGVLCVALAFSGIVAYLGDVGLTHQTIQQITRPGADVGRVLGTVFRARVIIVLGTVIGSWIAIRLMYRGPEEYAVMLAVILPTIAGAAMRGFASSYFWATQEMHVIAGLNIASQAFSAVALMLAYFLRWTVRDVAAIYGVSSLMGGFACLWLVRRQAPKISGWDARILNGLTSFTVGGIAGIAIPQLGPLILQRVSTATQVGYFAAASRIPTLLYAIPGCLATAWYPQLFLKGARDPAGHFALSADQLKLNTLLGIGLSLPVALYSRLLIRTILGPSWEAQTAPLLSLLSCMVVLNSITTPFADALTTKGLQVRRASAYSVALVVGFGLFARFGSTAGAFGAAAAAIITQALLSVGLILTNPSGCALLLVVGRRLRRPIILAVTGAIGTRMLLPEGLLSVALSCAMFFLVVAAADTEVRSSLASVAITLQKKWRYACSHP